MRLRGVVLAGGKGTRLGELTRITNKHLLPVGPYPMVYHPIKKLIGAGICDIMLVSGTEHMGDFVRVLGSGRDLGCNLTYKVQDEAGGIAQALGLAEGFCAGRSCVVLLGDNIFKASLDTLLFNNSVEVDEAVIVLKTVADPGRYGVAEVVGSRITTIEEKPTRPKSDYAVTGIYFYPPEVFDVIRTLKPSARRELEITDVNKFYLGRDKLQHRIMDSGYWTDAGTYESWVNANLLVHEDPPRF